MIVVGFVYHLGKAEVTGVGLTKSPIAQDDLETDVYLLHFGVKMLEYTMRCPMIVTIGLYGGFAKGWAGHLPLRVLMLR